jgi:hypothetical protein
MLNQRATDDLLKLCTAARAAGADFPTVWNTVLRGQDLIAGRPVQAMKDGHPVLKILLTTNRHLVCGPNGYSVE